MNLTLHAVNACIPQTTVFGTDDGDSFSLDKAILEATFGGIDDITAQLNLALAMDRAGLAKDTIFVESRKEELKVCTVCFTVLQTRGWIHERYLVKMTVDLSKGRFLTQQSFP